MARIVLVRSKGIAAQIHFSERLIMASIWLVLSDSDVAQGEGFHLTESSALARAEERRLEDRSIYEHSTQWLEISCEELRTLRG